MNLQVLAAVLLVGLNLTFVDLLIVRRYFQDGILYEDYAADSDNVRYTITAGEGWENLDNLVVAQGLRGKAMFCSRGAGSWLLYPDENYSFGTERQLRLLSGEECVPVDNIQSLQPLASINIPNKLGAAMYFSEKYFASKGEVVKKDGASAGIKSAIFIGFGNWTVNTGDKEFCVIASGEDGAACFVEDVEAMFGASGDNVGIKQFCGEDVKEMYELQTCYGQGFHVITYEFDLNLPTVKEICSAGSFDSSNQAQEKFLNVMKIWKIRMSKQEPAADFKFPTNIPNAVQRFTVLWQMVQMVGETCSAVDDEYLETLKDIFLMHLQYGKIWNSTDAGTRFEQSNRKWLQIQAFIADCALQVLGPAVQDGKPVMPIPPFQTTPGELVVFEPSCAPKDVSVMKNELEENAIEDFLNGESNDFVIEQIWLILNFISPYCNTFLGFKNNLWSDFPLTFKKDFLYPLQDQWKSPGKWSSYYPLMFNGFDMEEQRRSMISCVQDVILTTPFYDPLARPPSFYNVSMKFDSSKTGSTSSTGEEKTEEKRAAKFEGSLKEIKPKEAEVTPKKVITPSSSPINTSQKEVEKKASEVTPPPPTTKSSVKEVTKHGKHKKSKHSKKEGKGTERKHSKLVKKVGKIGRKPGRKEGKKSDKSESQGKAEDAAKN